jgi:hypothetical protein
MLFGSDSCHPITPQTRESVFDSHQRFPSPQGFAVQFGGPVARSVQGQFQPDSYNIEEKMQRLASADENASNCQETPQTGVATDPFANP